MYMYRVYVVFQLSSKPFEGTASVFFLSFPEYLITQQDLESIIGHESPFPEEPEGCVTPIVVLDN